MAQRINLRGVMPTVQTRLVPGQQSQPVPQTAKPMQPAPPAADVPSPAPTLFDMPAPKNLGSMKTTKDLKSVSEAIASAGIQSGSSQIESTPRPSTPGKVSKDLKSVSESVNDSMEENDTSGED